MVLGAMNPTVLVLSILFISLFSFPAWALEQEPPSGLEDTLASMVNEAYGITYTSRGWSNTYQLPQSEFSVDDLDFFDNSSDFAEVGLYALGLNNLLNPQFDSLDLNTEIESSLTTLAQNTLPWVWTPESESFGTHHLGTLPNKGVANVVEKVMGISGTSNVCHPEISLPYNTWGTPKDTINKQTTSSLTSLAGTGHLFLLAAEKDEAQKEKYLKIAQGIGDMLVASIVTPEGTPYGINANQTIDTYENTIPIGMMPTQFTILSNSVDTSLCSDGGTIKMHENRKTWIAQSAYFLVELSKETGETRYGDAAQVIEQGLLELQECDGIYKDYMRWEGPGSKQLTCNPDDGSESYSPYASNVTVAETKGFIIDTSLILYFLQKADPEIYSTSERYRNAVLYLVELEENDVGSGYNKNGSPIRYASYSLDVVIRPYAQILLSNVLLRASCVEDDSAMEQRLQTQAYSLMEKADTLIPSELDSKIANAISGDVGTNVFATSLAADNWKIITNGCKDCTDEDGDGYIDGACANDTVKYDCNDSDATIHPGAEETCDMIDQDCDGKIDEDFDGDGDGVSLCAEVVDCNDDNPEIYPGADEPSDDQDNDCNGKIDDAGFFVSVQTDQNQSLSGIDILVVEYGNACANSFVSPADSIEDIKLQCSTIGGCVTGDDGTCLVTITKGGKYQALAGVPEQGLTGEPVQYEVGKRVDVLLLADSNSLVEINDDTNASPVNENPFTSNPYMLGGIVLSLLIFAGIGMAYLYKTGKITPIKLGGTKPLPKEGGNTILTSPKMSKAAPGMNVQLPKISPAGLANKLVTGKLPGTTKAGNFPPKKNDGWGNASKPKKIWKDV
jgi:hypothetical protein